MVSLSIIIPTCRRSVFLESCLKSIYLQKHPKKHYEIIVVSDAYDKDTDVVIERYLRFGNLKYLRQKNAGPAAARNSALKIATGEIIAFLDDDCEVQKNWINNIIISHKVHPEIMAVVGKIIPKEKNIVSEFSNYFEITRLLSLGDLLRPNQVNNVSYKHKDIRNKLFNKRLRTAEDVDFNYRLFREGKHSIYNNKILIKHAYRKKYGEFFKQQYSFGVGRAFLFLHENDYPEKRNFWYWVKFLLTPFLSPPGMLKYAIVNKKKHKINYLYLSIIQQLSYWPGFIRGLFKYW